MGQVEGPRANLTEKALKKLDNKQKIVKLPHKFSLDSIGNAERFVHYHGNKIRYSYQQTCWYIWDGRRWKVDSVGKINELAKDTIKSMVKEAFDINDTEKQNSFLKWIARSNSTQARRNMIIDAKSIPGVPILVEELDNEPWLLNLLNGTLDLRTGKLHEHNEKQLITKLINITFDPKSTCPKWLKFLSKAMRDNPELIDFIQLLIGITLTGISLKKFFFLYGPTDTGKSKFIEVLSKLLGEYFKGVPIDALMAKKLPDGDAPNPSIARLLGTRFVAASETTESRRMNEALVKAMTGSDNLTVRKLHQDSFDFVPYYKLWIHGNFRPIINADDDAIWNRLILIPFDVVIPKSEQITTLSNELEEELSGILVWALQGCLKWVANNQADPTVPDGFQVIANDYKNDMDTLGEFIEDSCYINPDGKTASKVLYMIYRNWCISNNVKEVNNKLFKNKMEARGFRYKKEIPGIMVQGIKVIP